ncbi:MAG: DUF1353 domain-containing protein [Mycobacteriaceae bacterium]
MPFHISQTNSGRPHPELQVINNKQFALTNHFYYIKEGTSYRVPNIPEPGVLVTDLASVPSPLWGLFAPYGPQLLPALLHDDLCRLAREKQRSGDPNAHNFRRSVDELFRLALLDEGVGRIRARAFWCGGAVSGLGEFSRIAKWLMITHLILAVITFYLFLIGIILFPILKGLMLIAPFIAVLGAAIFWGPDRKLLFWSCLSLPPVVPVSALTLATSWLLSLPDWLIWQSAKLGKKMVPGAPIVPGPEPKVGVSSLWPK